QNEEKAKRAAELVIANKEIEFNALIADSSDLLKETEHRLNERNKELQALYGLSQLADNEILNLESLCRKVLVILKGAWQYPDITCCRIIIEGAEYCTDNFAETEWKQSETIKVNGEVIGSIDVLYLKKKKEADEGPFLTEERNLINDLAERMGHIIQRVRAEDKKQKDDALIRTLSKAIEQSPVTTVITDIKGNIEFVNPKFTETTGYTADEAIGKNPRILKSGFTPVHVHKELWDTILSGKNWQGEFQNRKKNGELYFESAVISPVKNDEGTIIRFLALKQDITQRKITEEKLRIIEERLETLSEHSRVVTWEVDTNGLYTYMSKVSKSVLGYNPEEIIGKKHFYDIHPEESREAFRAAAFAVFEKKVAFRDLENEIVPKNGEIVWVSTNGIPILDEGGNIIGYNGTDTDITERKKGEEEIMNMNKELIELNSEKDKFFSIIAHDLRGPFNGFLGLTDIFASELSKMNLEDIQKLALMMKVSANNLYQLLENLLEWAQMKRGLSVTNPKQFSFEKIICENILLLNEISSKKEITISSDIQGDLQVFADKYMIESAFRNILSNAIKFTDKGGIISVSAKLTAENMVELSVSDNGIGMNKERMENLFRLDVNTNRKGTDGEASAGLGLLICKEFLEMNRGQLFLESEVGKGSTFRFTLPYCDDNCYKKHEQKNAKKEKNKSERIQNLKILIAEDDQISAKLLARTLNTISREILNAGTGLEAVEICRNNPDIDLVLMDIKMPVMDGFEAASEIRKFNKDVVLIAQTAFAPEGYAEKTIAAGFNDYVAKLFDIETFEDIFKKHFS
ncbi:MAG: PAS domain S-box protein, partial [Ignavibacteriota bacterium]